MLKNSQPLPVNGFHRISELSPQVLANVVKRGDRLQNGWHERRPELTLPYRTIPAPNGESIVWLSPITSKYTLCCTRTGKVICWDVLNSECVAEWHSGDDWEIWKCRVEFDERTVYFALAKKTEDQLESECSIIALRFPFEVEGQLQGKPVFEKLANFKFPGFVIGVYLLNPIKRLLSAYIYLDGATIGLYVLSDWNVPSYTYIDTGIPYLNQHDRPREWSCIGYDPTNLVIHDEDHGELHQYYYPFSLLASLARTSPSHDLGSSSDDASTTQNSITVPAKLVPPKETFTLKFPIEGTPFAAYESMSAHFVRQWWPTLPRLEGTKRSSCTIMLLSFEVPGPIPVVEQGQQVPNAPGYDYPAGTTLFTIAQHYFGIPSVDEQLRWWYVREPFEIVSSPGNPFVIEDEPAQQGEEQQNPPEPALQEAAEVPPPAPGPGPGPDAAPAVPAGLLTDELAAANEDEEAVAQLFQEVLQQAMDAEQLNMLGEELADDEDMHTNFSPLIAVDFGCSAWLEFVNPRTEEIRLRFVMFPPVHVDRFAPDFDPLGSEVRTLATPDDVVLSNVCHLGLDQSQGTIILGLLDGSVYVLHYE